MFLNKIFRLFKTRQIRKNRHLGIRSVDTYDKRDYIYSPDISKSDIKAGFSSYFSLKNYSCSVLNQLQTNSCTGHSGIAATNIILSRFLEAKDHKLNPWFVYYFARKEDNSPVNLDNGATMRSLMKALQKYGVYRCDMSSPFSEPDADTDYSKCFHIYNYYRCNNNITQIKYALENDKLPVLLCFKVYSKDIDDYTGIIGEKDKKENFEGYHAICLTGYKYIKDKLYFEFQNSWGREWGDSGYGYLIEDYLKSYDLCPDIWIPTLKN